jgi:hypothetical protein
MSSALSRNKKISNIPHGRLTRNKITALRRLLRYNRLWLLRNKASLWRGRCQRVSSCRSKLALPRVAAHYIIGCLPIVGRLGVRPRVQAAKHCRLGCRRELFELFCVDRKKERFLNCQLISMFTEILARSDANLG